MSRRASQVLVALALALSLTSCGTYALSNGGNGKNVTTNDSTTQPYAKFFTYPYTAKFEIQPATGGKLMLKDGCLLLDNGETVSVPIFPHGITIWDEDTQTLNANGVDIPLNGELFTNGPLGGGKYDPNTDYNFVQKANPECLKGRDIIILGSQFMDIKNVSH